MRKATGSYRTYLIPTITVALVPEFAVRPAFVRTAAWVPALAVKDLSMVRTLMMMMLSFKLKKLLNGFHEM